MARVAQLPQEGDTVAGQYVLGPIVGRGATGVVYEARQTSLNRSVALKMLLPKLLGSDGIQERFKREARLASSLTHPNSVAIYAYGVHGEEPGVLGLPYIAMEFLEGEDLRQFLDRNGPLSVDDTVDIMCQALESLADAHSKGIIHRDLKPENLYLCEGPGGERVVKVLDFGIAKALTGEWGSLTRRLTQTGMMCGTPEYMAPEQATGQKDITPTVDVYAIGCIGYQMLTGGPPFVAPSPFAVALKHLSQPVPPLPAGLKDAEIDIILRQALGKKPESRFTDAAHFLSVLTSQIPSASSPPHARRARSSLESLRPTAPLPPSGTSAGESPTIQEQWDEEDATIDNSRGPNPFAAVIEDSLHGLEDLEDLGDEDLEDLDNDGSRADSIGEPTTSTKRSDAPEDSRSRERRRPEPEIPQRKLSGGTRLGLPALGRTNDGEDEPKFDREAFEAALLASMGGDDADLDRQVDTELETPALVLPSPAPPANRDDDDDDDEPEPTAIMSGPMVEAVGSAMGRVPTRSAKLPTSKKDGPATSIKRPTLTKLKAAAEKLQAAQAKKKKTATLVGDADVPSASVGEDVTPPTSDFEDGERTGHYVRPEEEEATKTLNRPLSPTLAGEQQKENDAPDDDDDEESTMMLEQPLEVALQQSAKPQVLDLEQEDEDEEESTMMLDRPLGGFPTAATEQKERKNDPEITRAGGEPVNLAAQPEEDSGDQEESTMMMDGGMLGTGAPEPPRRKVDIPTPTKSREEEGEEEEPTTMIEAADFFRQPSVEIREVPPLAPYSSPDLSSPASPPSTPSPSAVLARSSASASGSVHTFKATGAGRFTSVESNSEVLSGSQKRSVPEADEPTVTTEFEGQFSPVAGARQGEAEKLRLPRRPIVPRASSPSSSKGPAKRTPQPPAAALKAPPATEEDTPRETSTPPKTTPEPARAPQNPVSEPQ